MAMLIGMSPEVRGKNFEIDRDKFTIGRSATNQVSIDHPTVSGRHCCITRAGPQYTLTDLGSTNGTRVNSKEIQEIELHPKDLVQIGAVEFLFDAEGEARADTILMSQTQVEVTSGPATAPISFRSVSPFGARQKDNTALWWTLIVIIGILALAAVGWVVYALMGMGKGA